MAENNNGDRHFFTIDEAQSAEDLQALWGNWLFRDSLVIQVGEPGLAKTTFNYKFCKALVDGEEFLGIKPSCENIKVLYCDWESSRSLIKSRMRILGYPRHTENFMIFNDPAFSLKQIETAIDGLIEEHGYQFDVIFLDPLRMAFSSKDENDNSEASQQMKYLRSLSQKWNCSLVIIHHSSKGELTGTKKATGAYARTGLCDINWNFEFLGEGYGRNLFMFSIPKNRLIDDQFCTFIEKDNWDFKVVPPPLGYSVGDGEFVDGTVRYQARELIKSTLSFHKPKSPSEILEEIGSTYSRKTVHGALSQLEALGMVERASYGQYRRIE